MTDSLFTVSLGEIQSKTEKLRSTLAMADDPITALPHQGEVVRDIANQWDDLVRIRSMANLFTTVSGSAEVSPVPVQYVDVTERVLSGLESLSLYVRERDPEHFSEARDAWASLLFDLQGVATTFLNLTSQELGTEDVTDMRALLERADRSKAWGQIGWAEISASYHADRAEKAQTSAENAAGNAATNTLTKHYSGYATDQAKAAKWFRVTTIGVVILAIGIPAILHLVFPTDGSIAGSIPLLVLAAGLFGLSGYFARQAHLHRTLSTWAESIKIQLLTFDGFVSPVQNLDKKDDLRATFAGRVFGPQPKLKGESGVTASAPIIDSIITKIPRG